MFCYRYYGAVSEGFKEAVLKTAVPQGTEGSNPSCSETLPNWRGARAAESGSLLRS